MNQIVSALIVVLCSGFLQGAVAFGFAVFSVPLLLMLGFPIPEVLAICSVCTLVQAGGGVHHLRHVVPWKLVSLSVAVRTVTMVMGIVVLRILVTCPVEQINFWVGLMMLFLLLLLAAWKPTPRPILPMGWNLAAFLVSGFTGGLCSMDGPPLVLWAMAHDWTAERTRAFLFASFLGLVPFQLAMLYWTFGTEVVHGMMLGVIFAPVVMLGSTLGLRVGARFSKAFFLLAAIALNSMSPQIWSMFHHTS